MKFIKKQITKQPTSLRKDITITNTLRVLICFMLIRAFGATISFSDIDLGTYTLDHLTTGFMISGENSFGYSANTAGDIDGDGYDDMIVGTPVSGGMNKGDVYVIYGRERSSMLNNELLTTELDPQTTGFKIIGNANYDNFGRSVSTAGDINDDGFDDIIIGADEKGVAYVIYGRARSEMSNIDLATTVLNPAITGFVITGATNSQLGYSVRTAGDFNKDGYDDIILGAMGLGAAYVIYGGKKSSMQHIFLSTTALDPHTTGFKITGVAKSFLGVSVSAAGDIDKDGYDDIIVGAWGDITSSTKGAAYVIYGREKSSMSNIDSTATFDPQTTGFKITGSPSMYVGASVSTAGDVDKDGYGDIIIGASGSASTVGGAAYVIYGGERSKLSTLDLTTTTLDPLMTGFFIKEAGVSEFARSVSTAGDINKDGYSDILISAYKTNNYQGEVYVVYGGKRSELSNFDLLTKMFDPATTGFIIKGNAQYDFFGYSVNIAGDIDSDGHTEIIIGAYGRNSYKGTAYIFYACSSCPSCPAHCDQCESASVCTSCTNPYVMHKSQCLESCPDTFFASADRCEGKFTLSRNLLILYQSMYAPLFYLRFQASSTSPSTSSSASTSPMQAQEKASQAVSSAAKGVGSVICVGSATVPMTALVSKTVQNTRYLNLSVTYELAEIYKTWDTNMISWQVPEVFPDQDNFKTSPPLFAQYDIGSPFLVNFWPTLMNIGIGFTAFIVCLVLQKLLEQAKYEGWGYSLIQKFVAGSFNFALVQTYACLDDILFYLVLDSKTNPFKGFFSWASIISAILFLVLGCLLVFFNFWTVKKYQDRKHDKRELEAFNERNKYWELFYSDFNDDDLFSQSFFAIIIIRSTFSSFIITVLYEYPLMQTVYLVIMDGAVIMFLYFKTPFTTLRGKLAQYYYETITLLVHICTFILALQDSFQTSSEIVRTIMCTTMLYLNTALVGGGLGFMFIEIYKSISQKSRAAKRKERKSIPEDNQESQNLTRTASPSQPLETEHKQKGNWIQREPTLTIESFDLLPGSHNHNSSMTGLNMDTSHVLESNFNRDNSILTDLNPRNRGNRQKVNGVLPNIVKRKPRNLNKGQNKSRSKSTNNTRNARQFENV